MTIRDLMKAIPEEHWDTALIEIYIPQVRAGDEGTFPLIQISLEEHNTPVKHVRILLEADIY